MRSAYKYMMWIFALLLLLAIVANIWKECLFSVVLLSLVSIGIEAVIALVISIGVYILFFALERKSNGPK